MMEYMQLTPDEECEYHERAEAMLDSWATASCAPTQRKAWARFFERREFDHLGIDYYTSTLDQLAGTDGVRGSGDLLCFAGDIMDDASFRLWEIDSCIDGTYCLDPGYPVSKEVANGHARLCCRDAAERLCCIARFINDDHSDEYIKKALPMIFDDVCFTDADIVPVRDFLRGEHRALRGKLDDCFRRYGGRELKVASVLAAVDVSGHEQVGKGIASHRGFEQQANVLAQSCNWLSNAALVLVTDKDTSDSLSELVEAGANTLLSLGLFMQLAGVDSKDVLAKLSELIAKTYIDDAIPWQMMLACQLPDDDEG